MPRRLRSQLALILAVAMAPAGILAVWQALAGANEEIRQRDAVFASEMRATALKQRDALRGIGNELAAAADAAEIEFLRTGDCDMALTQLVAQAYFSRAVLLDRTATPVCGTDNWMPQIGLPLWKEFLAAPDATFSIEHDGQEPGIWPVVALHPTVFRRPEAFAVAAEVDLAYLRLLPVEGSQASAYGVIDSTGALLGAPETGENRKWLPSDPQTIIGPYERSTTTLSRSGVERVYLSQPLVEGRLWAVASVPETTVLEIVASPSGLTVLAPILLWLIAVGVAYVSMDKLVTRHVESLSRATARIGRGELDAPVRPLVRAPTEIRALNDSIRDMARNLQDRESIMRDLIEHQKNLILEIHHRVKNNLQMVTSLINIQLRRARTGDERQALRFLEDRVQSLAIVHHHLYGTEEVDRIQLDDLVRDICERLKLSMTPEGASVGIDYRLDGPVVDSRVATPVALFLTEAISNAFKHAVGQTGEHRIEVSLRTCGERFVLEIRNELTQPLPPEPFGRDRQRLGMRLLRSFAAQLDGSFEKIADERTFRLVLTAPIAARGDHVVAPAFSSVAR